MSVLFLCSMVCHAQDTSKAYRNTVAGSYNFWFYRPDEDESDGVHRPLLIFLHGASLCGTDLNKVKKYGPMEALKRTRHRLLRAGTPKPRWFMESAENHETR